MGRVQTVQATGKGWKLIGLLGFLTMVGGPLVYFMADDPAIRPAAIIATVGGLVVWTLGRAGAWWRHG